MSSETTTQGFDQVGSLRKISSPTVNTQLTLASHQDLLSLADGLETRSRAPGLSEGVRLEMLVEASHARLVAVKVDPYKSRKAKRSKADRLRRRIIHLRRRQRDFDTFADIGHNGFRVGSSSWSQHDIGGSNHKSPSGQTHPREPSR